MVISEREFEKIKKEEYDRGFEKGKWLYDSIKKQHERIESLLQECLKANEVNCKRGQYCTGCYYGVIVKTGTQEPLFCAYGQCENFKPKE